MELKVYIHRRPNLRDPFLEYEAFMGRDVLESMFDKMQVRSDVENLFLSFPERWLNIVEQRALLTTKVKEFLPNLKTLTIKTHSVYIIQCVRKENLCIVDTAMDETEDPYVSLCNGNVGNLFGPGLNVACSNGVSQHNSN